MNTKINVNGTDVTLEVTVCLVNSDRYKAKTPVKIWVSNKYQKYDHISYNTRFRADLLILDGLNYYEKRIAINKCIESLTNDLVREIRLRTHAY